MKNNVYKSSLDLHKKNRGKLSVASKVPLNNKNDLSLAYTPGVAEACRQIGSQKSKVFDFTPKGNMVAVVSDGSSILGLGNLGAHAAIPVMEGKAVLFKRFADIDAFPICLDTQDPKEIVNIIKKISPVFGAINLEDISAPRCFEIERELRKELDIPVMHDDQHGTAVVVLAGLINALKIKKQKKNEVKIVINGAGSAGLSITDLLLKYGFRDIVVLDSRGPIYKGRGDLNPEKTKISLLTNKQNQRKGLSECLVGADIFIGVSKPRVLTKAMVKTMRDRPIIFALANPEPEIMPDEAKSAGAFIVATGRSDFPNQINNALAFPGIFRGALDNKINQFSDKMFIKAAETLALATKNISKDKIIPDPFQKGLALAIAKAIK